MVLYRFGPYEIDFLSSELRKSGTRIRLAEQPMKLLESLLEQPGSVVTREQLRDRLWPSDTFVDFEPSLNGVVAKLRQALSDSADQPLYIETVARKGYRFIAPVTTDVPLLENARGQDSAALPAPGKQALRLWTGAGLLVVGSLALWAIARPAQRKADQPMVWLDLDVGEEFSQPAISRDGMKIVLVTKGGLVVRRLDQPKITPLAGTEGASLPFFSPSGQWVGFFVDRKLRKVAVEGGASATLCDAPLGGGGSWGEDDRIVVLVNFVSLALRLAHLKSRTHEFLFDREQDRRGRHAQGNGSDEKVRDVGREDGIPGRE